MPWLTFFAVRAVPDIGAFTAYSHDDWLAYQVAGYRIFMGGYWLEGGSTAFDYQPLYRWISGALHMVFGDSSAGEIIVDASALLSGALLAFWMVKATAGFRWAVAAGAVTLMTFSTGTTWYFVGRGLSETIGAGFGFLAAFMLLRGRLGRPTSIAAAGVLAVLMFYTRLNFGAAAVLLAALLLPLSVTTKVSRATIDRVRRIRLWPVAGYCGLIAAGVLLFMSRTWWYTGRFSVLYGTSLKNNDIGLRVDTIADPAVWGRIRHSVASLIFMNEPPHFDVRALFVVAGMMVVVLGAIQVPGFRRLPLALVIVTFGTCLSALFVHTHNYPGPDVDSARALRVCGGVRGCRVDAVEARIVNRLLPWLLLIAAAVVYTWRLGETPTYVSPDEAIIAVDAHSVATTGRDMHGALLPLYFFIQVIRSQSEPVGLRR